MSDHPELPEIRYTLPEIEHYYPEHRDAHAGKRVIAVIFNTIGFIIIIAGFADLVRDSIFDFIVKWFIGFVVFGIGLIIHVALNIDINNTVANRIFLDDRKQKKDVEMTQNTLKSF